MLDRSRSPSRSMYRFIAAPIAACFVLGACGGVVESGTSGTGGTGGASSGAGGSATSGGVGSVFVIGGATSMGGAQGGSGHTSRVPLNHRASATPCPVSSAPRPPPPLFPTCTNDADCTYLPGGRCDGVQCNYDCTSDRDCGPGLCRCSDEPIYSLHQCTHAACRIDADCPGSYCSPTFGTCGNYQGVVDYRCHTPDDECTDDGDCTATVGAMAYCMYEPLARHWICGNSHCAG